MQYLKKEYRKHIIFWLCFFVFEVQIEYAYLLRDLKLMPWYGVVWVSMQTEFLLVLIKIPFAYIIANNIFGFVEDQKPFFSGILRIFLCYVITIVVNLYMVFYVFYPLIYNQPVSDDDTVRNRSLFVFLDLTFAAGVFFAVFQYFQLQRWKLKEKELVNERIVAELNLIKSQTHPHFLFNTLNTLYGLSRKNSPDTPVGILKLSNLLRYLLYEASSTHVPIEKEISVIQDYIKLEKLRWADKIAIQFDIDVDGEDNNITPSILLQLVENAFKHGAGEARFNAFIVIQLTVHRGFLQFSIRNSAEGVSSTFENGLGLKNIRRIVDLSYADYHFNAELINNEFLVDLNITLYERKNH